MGRFHAALCVCTRGTACALLLAALATPAGADAPNPLPRVLVIGDSISIGYMEPLTELLRDRAEVVHNPGNAQHSGFGRDHLEEWLGDGHWDVIHFNHGLHDLKYVDDEGKNVSSEAEGHLQVPVDRYRENMEAIVKRLKETGATLIFATTTPFPEGVKGPVRKIDDLRQYNAAALEVMKEHDVRVNDLHAFAEPRLADLQLPENVHFTEEGSAELAKEVARHVLAALDDRQHDGD